MALGLVPGVQAAMVPGVIVPPCRAVEQGARVGAALGAVDHTGDDQRIGRGVGTQRVQGADQHLHPGLDDAQQGMDDGGGARPRTPMVCSRARARLPNAMYQSRRWSLDAGRCSTSREPHAGQPAGLHAAKRWYHVPQRRQRTASPLVHPDKLRWPGLSGHTGTPSSPPRADGGTRAVHGVQYQIEANDRTIAHSACSRLVPLPMPPRNQRRGGRSNAQGRRGGGDKGGSTGWGCRVKNHYGTGSGLVGRQGKEPSAPAPPLR